ncbi:hypothetical protein LEMLEM_LOCUS6378 [Lemmus lemmus]
MKRSTISHPSTSEGSSERELAVNCPSPLEATACTSSAVCHLNANTWSSSLIKARESQEIQPFNYPEEILNWMPAISTKLPSYLG